MYRYILLFLILSVSFIACKQEVSDSQLQAINESLVNSNSVIEDHNRLIYHTIEGKLRDPQTHERALIWMPKATSIQHSSTNIKILIDSLKNKLIMQSDSLRNMNAPSTVELLAANGPGHNLFNKLVAFKDTLTSVFNNEQFVGNQNICAALKKDSAVLMKSVTVIPDYVNNMSNEDAAFLADKWIKKSFESSSPLMTMTILNKIENEVAVSENKLIQYCNNFIVSYVCGYSVFAGITSLSSSYVKSGQYIQVTAGVGMFSAASDPQIFIDGKEVMLNPDYVAEYGFTAQGKPGKYKVPVKIMFKRQDGTPISLSKNLEYTIGK